MDEGEPERDGSARVGDLGLDPVDEHLALVRGYNPTEDVHEGRFTGPVGADEAVNLAAVDLQTDPAECPHRAKGFDQSLGNDERALAVEH